MFPDLLKKAKLHHGRGLPFVLYRKPNEQNITGLFQNDIRLHHTKDFSEPGFVFSPFDTDKPSVLLLPDEIDRTEYSRAENSRAKAGTILDEEHREARQEYIDLVKKGVSEIENGTLKKIVLSRKLELTNDKDPFQILTELLNKYPGAFCYLWQHPGVGLWLGATPETLLSLKTNFLTTVSLAGTQKANNNADPVWGGKEIEEQAMVTQYIIEALDDHIGEVSISEVTSVKAGKLWHLRTVVSGNLRENSSVAKVIGSLHPTPAVCGLPLQAAKIFLSVHEEYDREYYTGFLGELNFNADRETHLFVNLRCLQLKKARAIIYVGGGVTKDSKPEKEWQETLDKTSTMKGVLFNSEE